MNWSEAARIGGIDRHTLRDWVHQFNEHGRDSLTNAKGAGRPRLLNDEQMRELAPIVETGPDREVDGVVRWRRIDVIDAFKNFSDTLAAHVTDLPKGTPVEVWFQDEARIGQSERDQKLILWINFPDERSGAHLGEERNPAPAAGRPALRQHLSVRRYLSKARNRRGTGSAQSQH